MGTGVGVTVGSSSLRAMAVRRKGPLWQVTAATAGGLAAGDDAARVAEARGALAAASLRGEALAGLTGKDLIVRYTHVPRVPDWRLEMLMRFEIQEVSEQSGGDVAADWALLSLPAAAGSDQTVLVALARNAHLRPRLEALAAAGLSSLGGCPRSVALYHAFVTNAKVPPGEVTMILHLGGENTDVAIQRDGALLFARNLVGGGRPFTEALVQAFHVAPETAEKMKIQKGNVTPRGRARYADSSEEKVANSLLGVAGTVVSAVHSSLMFCKAQTKLSDLRIDRVVLSGGGARMRKIPEYLSQALGIPVEPFDPFETVDLSALPAETAEAVRVDGQGMAAVLGLAQMAADRKAFRLEILPEADRKRRVFLEKTAWLIASGVLAAGGLVFLYGSAAAQESAANLNRRKMAEKASWAESQRGKEAKLLERLAASGARQNLLVRETALGPRVIEALDMVQEDLDRKPEYQAIHFTRVSARFDREAMPKRLLAALAGEGAAREGEGAGKEGGAADGGGKPGAARAGGGAEGAEALKLEVGTVTFEATVKAVDRDPGQVYGDFNQALEKVAQERLARGYLDFPGGYQPQKGKESGTFRLRFVFFDGTRGK